MPSRLVIAHAKPSLPGILCLRINGLPDKNRLAPVARNAFTTYSDSRCSVHFMDESNIHS